MDILHDTTFRDLTQLAQLPGVTIPAYVLEYKPLDKEAASTLEESLFADPDLRQYPVDSKANTWLSSAYFALKQAHNDAIYAPNIAQWIKSNLLKAASTWDIRADVDAVLAAVAPAVIKTAADSDDNYGWLVKDASGAVIKRRYPLHNADGVFKAAEYFTHNRRQYPQAVRREIATNILRKAAEHAMDISILPHAVLSEGGAGLPQKSVVMSELLHRARLSKDAEAGMALLNLNNIIAAASPDEVLSMLPKVAEIIADFDAVESLRPGKDVIFPADVLHNISEKSAEDMFNDIVQVAGVSFSKIALSSLPQEMFTNVLGEKFAEQFPKDVFGYSSITRRNKLAAALEALPAEDQHALVEHLRATLG